MHLQTQALAPSGADPVAHFPAASAPAFTIHTADTQDRRRDASRLIRQRYSWRGYRNVTLPLEQRAQRYTLTAVDRSQVLGTITVGLDGPEGLNCDDLFRDEVSALRAEGLRLCEFTRLAVDAATQSRQVLAALFHAAYLVAYRIGGFDRLLIEVNPRHVRVYERMFGACVVGAQRHHPGVDAPAVLLSLDLADIAAQLAGEAGAPGATTAEHPFYALAFSPLEEARHIARLAPAAAVAQRARSNSRTKRTGIA
ncbi:MAG: long-chain N-acyl amino acid synthase [Rubrivivax sp.]|nr:long-chain N-acyl amino acid synthase [Rubrivivax sp.]